MFRDVTPDQIGVALKSAIGDESLPRQEHTCLHQSPLMPALATSFLTVSISVFTKAFGGKLFEDRRLFQ
jgi:hypothetical protein